MKRGLGQPTKISSLPIGSYVYWREPEFNQVCIGKISAVEGTAIMVGATGSAFGFKEVDHIVFDGDYMVQPFYDAPPPVVEKVKVWGVFKPEKTV